MWRAIARKEVRGLTGTRLGKYGIAAVALVFLGAGYLLPTAMPEPTTADYAAYLRGVLGVVLPLFGLLLGYRAVVAERAAGRLALLLSLPHSRRAVVVAKFLGRGAVLAATVTAGALGGAALVNYPFGSFEVGTFAVYLVLTLLYGLAFVAVGVALSTLTASTRLATAGAFGVFFAFAVAWSLLPGPLFLGLEYLGWATDRLPDWALFLHGAEPGMLYRRLLDAFVADVNTGPYLGPDAPWYLGGPAAAVLLVAWVVAPVAGGYLRFRVTDL